MAFLFSDVGGNRFTTFSVATFLNKLVLRANRFLRRAHLATLKAGVEVLNGSRLVAELGGFIFFGGIFICHSWLDSLLEGTRLSLEVLDGFVFAG